MLFLTPSLIYFGSNLNATSKKLFWTAPSAFPHPIPASAEERAGSHVDVGPGDASVPSRVVVLWAEPAAASGCRGCLWSVATASSPSRPTATHVPLAHRRPVRADDPGWVCLTISCLDSGRLCPLRLSHFLRVGPICTFSLMSIHPCESTV